MILTGSYRNCKELKSRFWCRIYLWVVPANFTKCSDFVACFFLTNVPLPPPTESHSLQKANFILFLETTGVLLWLNTLYHAHSGFCKSSWMSGSPFRSWDLYAVTMESSVTLITPFHSLRLLFRICNKAWRPHLILIRTIANG